MIRVEGIQQCEITTMTLDCTWQSSSFTIFLTINNRIKTWIFVIDEDNEALRFVCLFGNNVTFTKTCESFAPA